MEFFILLSKIINEQGGKLRAGWEENLKNLSEHALLLGTSEYLGYVLHNSSKAKSFQEGHGCGSTYTYM